MNNRQRVAVLSIVVTALSLPAYADRGGDAYKQGEKAQRKGNLDEACAFYKQAYTKSPDNAKYFAAYARVRFSAGQQHVRNGQLLRSAGQLAEAMAEFQHAVEIDPSTFAAAQELRRTADMLHRQEQARSAPKATAQPAKPAAAELADAIVLRPLSNAPITFRMTANADVAYKTIGKLAGLNVLIDPEYHPQKLTVELNDVTLREALDMVRLQSKTFWRPVSSNTIFVTADSPTKRKDLETNVMRTFYLRNITSPSELQEAANVVRQLLDVSRVQLLQTQDALIVRGTPDQMELAGKLLAEIDTPKSEVVIDIAVMQVSRDRLRNFGANVPTSVSVGYVGPGSGSSSTSSSSGAYTLHFGTFALSVPGAQFTALATDSNTKLLQNPEIRALNDEKATLRIGDRIPIATGSYSPGTVSGGSAVVNTQFQYIDVGVNIDITPHIHEHEVTLKMSLEISSVTGSQDIGGITEPVIGQRRIEHETRLADGEVNLLGGILEDSETQSLSGLPWISKVPLLKYFFAQDNRDRRETEIVFAITPHIIRSQEIADESLKAIEIGTASAIELRRKPPAPTVTAENQADAAKPRPAAAPAAPAPATTHPVTPSPAPQTSPGTGR
jgi:general secretion pathway protein D